MGLKSCGPTTACRERRGADFHSALQYSARRARFSAKDTIPRSTPTPSSLKTTAVRAPGLAGYLRERGSQPRLSGRPGIRFLRPLLRRRRSSERLSALLCWRMLAGQSTPRAPSQKPGILKALESPVFGFGVSEAISRRDAFPPAAQTSPAVLIPLCLRKANFLALVQIVKADIGDAVAMEVDGAAIAARYEAVIRFGVKLRDDAVRSASCSLMCSSRFRTTS